MENKFEYLERIAQSNEVEMLASDINEMQHIVPIFKNGHECAPWEIDMHFPDNSKRVWIVKYDKLADGSENLNVTRKKFK